MRKTQSFTISLPPDLAAEADRLAGQERVSRSRLFREALRLYVNSGRRWERVLDFAPRAAAAAGLGSEEAIDAAVDEAVRDLRGRRRALRA